MLRIAKNSINYLRTKHIRNKFYFIRELVAETGNLVINYINIIDMLADSLTKPLSPQLFIPYRTILRLALRGVG